MSTPEIQGGEPETLWEQWSRIRDAKKQEWNARRQVQGLPPLSQRALSRLLWDCTPLTMQRDSLQDLHKGADAEVDTSFMTKDAFDLEAEDPVLDRLEAMHRQFHGEFGQAQLPGEVGR